MMHEIHVIVLPTGTNEIDPLCITLPKPKLHSSYDICYEIQKIICNNRSDLQATYGNNELYWKMRERQNSNMMVCKTLVIVISINLTVSLCLRWL